MNVGSQQVVSEIFAWLGLSLPAEAIQAIKARSLGPLRKGLLHVGSMRQGEESYEYPELFKARMITKASLHRRRQRSCVWRTKGVARKRYT